MESSQTISHVKSIPGECKKLTDQLAELLKELNETKSQVVVAEYQRDTEIRHQDRKAQEEIASLQQLVHGSLVFAFNSGVSNAIFDVLFSRLQKQLKSRV